MSASDDINQIIQSRQQKALEPFSKQECEGGCGIIGFACDTPVAAKHLLPSLIQMRNRGNGKGGGIAAAGLMADFFGISQQLLDRDYLLAIAYLDMTIKQELEDNFIKPLFEIDHIYLFQSDPDVAKTVAYFVRVKNSEMENFRKLHAIYNLEDSAIEDEIVYQNSFQLNSTYYATSGEKKAFVLSHGKNLLVLKCIGYAEDAICKYHIEDLQAHVFIGHHRYPTKGKVWHPAGAHPFIGLHEALVHNGDFANYSAICTYLAQRNIHPLFATDTEVAALLFDLLLRTYGYPLEYVMEAIAPTTEQDFYNLSSEKQHIYERLQKTHLHASPDGPWFFILAQSLNKNFKLIGITDTSMLRPHVFAMQSGAKASIGAVASEKQAIDALLLSLSSEDDRFWPKADHYWSCRGGSHTDGGAFTFSINTANGKPSFECGNKFGKPFAKTPQHNPPAWQITLPPESSFSFPQDVPSQLFEWAKAHIINWGEEEARLFFAALVHNASSADEKERAFFVLRRLIDLIYPLKNARRSYICALADLAIAQLVRTCSNQKIKNTLVLNAEEFKIDGPDSLSSTIVHHYRQGVKKFIIGNCKGHRFIGNGLGPISQGVQIDIYGSSGDYVASGIDGAQIFVHGNAQDQCGQILKDGKLVVFGDVGQTLLYGAKGGVAFVRGSVAGRALINAVGAAKLIVNGTALDYFAESFMAGDPLSSGGFAIINCIAFNEEGELYDLDPPYPGGNLFSLASGGAIYIRDPDRQIQETQINGGKFTELSTLDQNLIAPYLEENAELFDIPVSRLLEKNGNKLTFYQAFRKIVPSPTHFVDPESAWVKHNKPRKSHAG